MTLQVLISTMGRDGIERVAAMRLPRIDNVSYLVAWQCAEGGLPDTLARGDVEVSLNPGIGLSQNRNHALDRATGEILLIGDDDLEYRPQALTKIVSLFKDNPQLDVATFRYDGKDDKTYPETETPLGHKLPRGYYVSSIEIAMRRATAGTLRFNENMGLGAWAGSGEESLWLLSARRAGLMCRFIPLTICTHLGPSTGNRTATPASLRGNGMYMAKEYPWTVLPRVVLKAYRLARAGRADFFPAAFHQLAGVAASVGIAHKEGKHPEEGGNALHTIAKGLLWLFHNR